MKLVLLNSYSFLDFKGGAEHVNELLSHNLKNGDKIYMLTTRLSRYTDKKCFKNGSVIHIKFDPFWPGPKPTSNNRIINYFWHASQIISPFSFVAALLLFKRLKPDFILVSNIYEFTIGYILAIKLLKIKHRLWIHDYNWLCINSNAYNSRADINCNKQCTRCKFSRLAHRFFFERSKKLFISSISRSTYAKLTERTQSDPIIPNACTNFAQLLSIENNYSSNKIRFGFLGSPIHPKGLDLLLQAFNSQPSHPNISIELNIGGVNTSDYFLRLIARYSENKQIRFLGFVDPLTFFREIDVLVLPSRWRDTYPGVCVEAILAKKIIVIPDHVGAIDLVGKFSTHFYVYSHHDSQNTLSKQLTNLTSSWPNAKSNISLNNTSLRLFCPALWADRIHSLITDDILNTSHHNDSF